MLSYMSIYFLIFRSAVLSWKRAAMAVFLCANVNNNYLTLVNINVVWSPRVWWFCSCCDWILRNPHFGWSYLFQQNM